MRSVWFIWLIWFALFNQTNKTNQIKRNRPDRPNRPNEQDRPTFFFYSLLQYKNECADIHVATGIDLLTKFYL